LPADFGSHIINALIGALHFIQQLAPYLIAGIVIAALVNTFASRKKLARLLQGRKWWLLPAASLVGAVSPACTYGTVPIFMEMIKGGAPMAPAATFLVASTLVNPQMFLLTAGALGAPIALAQAGASIGFAMLIGAVVSRLSARGIDLEGSELKAARQAETGRHGTEGEGEEKRSARKHLSWPKRLGLNLLDLTEFVGFYFVMGTLVAALVAEFVPAGLVIGAVGEGKWWAIPFATVVSIPTYVCGGGMIPFLAQAKAMGMASGAVLAFLIAGPATRITALSALAVLFSKRAVTVYVLLLLVFATILGIAFGGVIQAKGVTAPTAF
jgi:uncharacterized membrane protein YraQ (UPF0718 family)